MGSFFLELKSICKSYRFFALVFVIILLQLVSLQRAIEQEPYMQQSIQEGERFLTMGAAVQFDRYVILLKSAGIEKTPEELAKIQALCQYYHAQMEKRNEARVAKDWSAYNQLGAERALLNWRYSKHSLPTPEEYYGKGWDRVTARTPVPEFDSCSGALGFEDSNILHERLLYWAQAVELGGTDLPPARMNSTRPWYFLSNFLRKGLPGILGIVVLLLTVGLLAGERRWGTVKGALSGPRSRSRYLIRKLSLGFIAATVALILALSALVFTLGLKHGFKGLAYPVVLDKYVLSHVSVHPDNPTDSELFGIIAFPIKFKFQRIPYFTIAPLWQLLALTIFQLLFFILFCTALAQLVSVLFRNEIIAHLAAAVIFAAGTTFGSIFPGLSTSAWDLFSKADVIPILEGWRTSTYLGSVLVLIGGTILLFIASTAAFRKQNIV